MKSTIAFAVLAACCGVGSASDFVIPRTEFAQRVVADYPGLAEAKTDIARIRLLRQWCWSHVDWGLNSQLHDEFARSNGWRYLPVDQMFAAFDRDEGGVICGGVALCLRRLYEHFGYDAASLGSGELAKDGLGHVVTLVRIRHKDRPITIISDPSFDLDFIDSESGDPIDYFDVLDRLEKRRHESIKMWIGDWRKAPRLPEVVVPAQAINRTPEEYIPGFHMCVNDNTKYHVASNGSLVFSSPRLWQTYNDKFLWRNGKALPWMQEIIDAGYPPSVLYIYSRPLWLSIGTPNRWIDVVAGKSAERIAEELARGWDDEQKSASK